MRAATGSGGARDLDGVRAGVRAGVRGTDAADAGSGGARDLDCVRTGVRAIGAVGTGAGSGARAARAARAGVRADAEFDAARGPCSTGTRVGVRAADGLAEVRAGVRVGSAAFAAFAAFVAFAAFGAVATGCVGLAIAGGVRARCEVLVGVRAGPRAAVDAGVGLLSAKGGCLWEDFAVATELSSVEVLLLERLLLPRRRVPPARAPSGAWSVETEAAPATAGARLELEPPPAGLRAT